MRQAGVCVVSWVGLLQVACAHEREAHPAKALVKAAAAVVAVVCGDKHVRGHQHRVEDSHSKGGGVCVRRSLRAQRCRRNVESCQACVGDAVPHDICSRQGPHSWCGAGLCFFRAKGCIAQRQRYKEQKRGQRMHRCYHSGRCAAVGAACDLHNAVSVGADQRRLHVCTVVSSQTTQR